MQFEPGSLHTTSHVSTSLKSLLQKASQSQEQPENLSTDDVEMTTTIETTETSTTYSTTTSESEKDKLEDQNEEENSFVHEMMIQSARRPNDDFELPDFEICPILPDLPGESGSIRKVRDTERTKVNRRIEGEMLKIFRKLKMY